jgi:hypothetical protein
MIAEHILQSARDSTMKKKPTRPVPLSLFQSI